ncbi:unnamed protein product [Prorocentrum cordatum]|uniref:Calcineurin-like phosphoesterase domain-containing protein n=1 Tax=Prorocentrum cordatum TaxID=2364126 RepID=A0ABN9T8Q8_9DINO|nr:unnamed protein product [Polarella glacialis]
MVVPGSKPGENARCGKIATPGMPRLSDFAWCCCCRVPIDSHCEPPECVVDDVAPSSVHPASGCAVHRVDVTSSEGTVLLHCGDFTGGTKYGPEQAPGGAAGVRDFNSWLAEVPYRHKVVVCGNHETTVPADPARARGLLSSATHYLCAEAAEVCGLKVFGAPHHPGRGCCYRKDAFGASLPEREKVFSRVPPGTHLLATHCPPYSVRDAERPGPVGCGAALLALRRVQPVAHVFGHVHPHRGVSRMWHAVGGGGGARGAHEPGHPAAAAVIGAASGAALGASQRGAEPASGGALEAELKRRKRCPCRCPSPVCPSRRSPGRISSPPEGSPRDPGQSAPREGSSEQWYRHLLLSPGGGAGRVGVHAAGQRRVHRQRGGGRARRRRPAVRPGVRDSQRRRGSGGRGRLECRR